MFGKYFLTVERGHLRKDGFGVWEFQARSISVCVGSLQIAIGVALKANFASSFIVVDVELLIEWAFTLE